MNCSDTNIISLIREAGPKAEYQAVKCLKKCQPQAHAILQKMYLQEEEERNSIYYYAMAEFFIQVRKERFVLTGEARICTYLTEIARRKWLGAAKKNKKPDVTYAEPEVPAKAPANEQLHAALQELSASDRHILIAFYFYGLSLKDYASQKGISYDTAKKRISRARERLKIILKPVGK